MGDPGALGQRGPTGERGFMGMHGPRGAAGESVAGELVSEGVRECVREGESE